jgi:hypothetical protein
MHPPAVGGEKPLEDGLEESTVRDDRSSPRFAQPGQHPIHRGMCPTGHLVHRLARAPHGHVPVGERRAELVGVAAVGLLEGELFPSPDVHLDPVLVDHDVAADRLGGPVGAVRGELTTTSKSQRDMRFASASRLASPVSLSGPSVRPCQTPATFASDSACRMNTISLLPDRAA